MRSRKVDHNLNVVLFHHPVDCLPRALVVGQQGDKVEDNAQGPGVGLPRPHLLPAVGPGVPHLVPHPRGVLPYRVREAGGAGQDVQKGAAVCRLNSQVLGLVELPETLNSIMTKP